MIEKKYILGIGITNATKKEILEYMLKSLENFKKKYYIVTPNPEFLVLASKNKDFKRILNNAEIAINDGVGLSIAGKFLDKTLSSRFTGVDLVKNLCRACEEKPITVGFLGGRGGVAERTAECLQKEYPKLKIGFVGEEWPDNLDDRKLKMENGNSNMENRKWTNPQVYNVKNYESRIMNQENQESEKINKKSDIHNSSFINHHSVDILFVAFGAPKQEIWISENLDKIPVKIAIGVGGAFDYLSGKITRAPQWMQNIGLEWLYRLVRQPWRIRRQFSLIEFVYLVFKQKLSSSIN